MEGRRLRVAIVGSRDYPRMDQVRRYVATLHPHTIIVSGQARGVDIVAREAAISRHMNVVDVPALWDQHGRGAGFRRNSIIIEIADEVVAFWDGSSAGTRDTINKARESGKPVKVYNESGLHDHFEQMAVAL